MTQNLAKKRIIMIHGLASKPPQKNLHSFWSNCIIENIRNEDNSLAVSMAKTPKLFVSAYWANATPHHIEDDSSYVKELDVQVKNVIDKRKNIKDEFHVGTEEKVGDFFKDKGVDLVKLLAGALTVKDEVMKNYFRETKLYDEDQYIADRMREPLEIALRKAWDDNCDVALISHSMGTFISYDVLWRFSHRKTSEFSKYQNKRVQLFITMGSPLGDSTVRGILFSRFHKSYPMRQYPVNIDFWHNYACLGDVVSHYNNFEEVFYNPMRELNIFPNEPKYRAIDYVNLHNPYEVVTHEGNQNREKRDPHKEYGYLVQPRLGTWLIDFLKNKLTY